MITELIVKSAVEAVIGQGFKALVERVFSQGKGRSDRELLEAVLIEVHRHGGQIGNFDNRISQLEIEIARLQAASANQSGSLPSSVGHAFIPSHQNGAFFNSITGGSMSHYNRMSKKDGKSQ
jgi:hypothetical protein